MRYTVPINLLYLLTLIRLPIHRNRKVAIAIDQLGNSFYSRASHDVSDLCAPLLKRFGIKYFDYTRFYQDNTCISFFSNPAYLDYFLNSKNIEYKAPPSLLVKGKYLWSSYIGDGFLEKASEYFDYFNGITFIKPKTDYIEQYNFAGAHDNVQLLDLFTNHAEILEIFVSYFQEQISELIKKAERNKILLPGNMISAEKSSTLTKPEDIELFLQDISKHKKKLKNKKIVRLKDMILTFTKREFTCLQLLLQGLSNKEIANRMNISYRTVEDYIRILFTKTKSNSRRELILEFSEMANLERIS